MRSALVFAALLIGAGAVAIAAPPERDEREKSADPRDKMICKRFLETGSLVKATRVCKTKREWDAARMDARQSVRQGSGCMPGMGANC